MEKTITQHIEKDRKELDSSTLSPQRRRHLEAELESLERYRQEHPGEDKDPTPLELYCNEHPEALECRLYNV
jgi:hypothetical protein